MEYNVITYCNQFVDTMLLHEGIYITSIPTLYDCNTTIEMLIEQAEYNALGIDNSIYNFDKYIKNLKNCTMCKVKLEKLN